MTFWQGVGITFLISALLALSVIGALYIAHDASKDKGPSYESKCAKLHGEVYFQSHGKSTQEFCFRPKTALTVK